jgi:uncharacterized oxidoreductase
MKLTNNTILITGGSTGIGLELAKQLQKRGNKVIVTGRNQAKLDSAKEKVPGIHVVRSDVSKLADVEELYAQVTRDYPDLDVLINNAGVMKTINLHTEDPPLEDLGEEIDINFVGPVRLVRRFLAHLKSKPEAAIVNVSSGLAYVPFPIAPIYSATKAALHSFTLSLRVQLKNTHVKVFELAPPTTETELLSSFDADDMKGIAVMKLDEMVADCIRGMESDRFEIRPGQSNQLRFMNRLAPDFILGQLSKPVDRMLSK